MRCDRGTINVDSFKMMMVFKVRFQQSFPSLVDETGLNVVHLTT